MSHRSSSSRDPAVRQACDAALAESQARATMRLEEQWTGDLLVSLLGGERWLARDLPDVNGLHDLDIVLGDGSRIAVEVTTHTAGNRAAFHAELDRTSHMRAASLEGGWWVHIDVPESEAAFARSIRPLFARLNSELEPLLAEVELAGLQDEVTSIDPSPRSTEEHPVCSKLRALQVRHAQAFRGHRPGYIWLHQAPVSTWFGADDIADAVEHEITPNRDKLARARAAGAAEAHLFVWIPAGSSLSDAAHAAVKSDWEGRYPRRPDMMGLDSVWVTAAGPPGGHSEFPGYTCPIWQLSQDGWRRWDREFPTDSPRHALADEKQLLGAWKATNPPHMDIQAS